MKTYKVFWQNLYKEYRPYGYPLYHTDFRVETFTSEEEMMNFANNMAKQKIYCYLLDYKAEKGIGDLARHINQCYGMSQWSYERDLSLAKQMLNYCKRYQFRVLVPFEKN